MKLVKSLLLGSAAGFAALTGAQAADLPVKKAAPVEYVRVCSAYGAGFFYIPGTDTCLRVGGRARFEYHFSESFNRNTSNGDVSGYRALGRLNIDARTQTAYGTLRTFVRFDIATRTGAYLTSGSGQRRADSFPALGQDTFGRAQKFVDVDKAFIQFAGLTAGRAQSFFDFYAHDLEFVGATSGSDANTNLLAYTATFGQGFSATVSMEDPTYRRSTVFSNVFSFNNTAQTGFNAFLGTTANSPIVVGTDALGNPTAVSQYDVTQKNRLPDFVGNLRYDAPWGSAQLSAAVHEINVGSNTGPITGVNGGPGVQNFPVGRVPNEYGWAVQGGLKINTPYIAPGDVLWLQGAYGEGALKYTGAMDEVASDIVSAGLVNGAAFPLYLDDAILNPLSRRLSLSQSFSATVSFLHYWAPEWRSAVFGSYGEINYGRNARNALIAANSGGFAQVIGVGAGALATNNAINAFSSTLRDVNLVIAGASLIWSPVRDLDIGVEGIYQRAALNNGRTNDSNRSLGAVAGVPVRQISAYDNFMLRFRVQRDF